MLLLLQILVGIALGYAALYWLVPPGNPLYETLRFPYWFVAVNRLEKPPTRPKKIKYGKHFRQYLLHFAPAESDPVRQHVVIYIHGSGWQAGRPEMFQANAQWLTAQGFHAFFLSHRRIPQCDIRQLREDTALAIKAVVEEMKRQGLSDKKILLCGNSAGGNLCALALLDATLLPSVGLKPSIISALALFAAPLDLTAMWPSPPLLMLTKFKQKDLFCLANPIHHLASAPELPILLVHGDRDGIVEYKNAVLFNERLRKLGANNLRFETLPDGNHLDSASWCFPQHPCTALFKAWLEEIEKGSR